MTAVPSAAPHEAGLRVGWCPGVLRPMRVGDGLLLRVKPRGHRLTLAQARAVAEAATRFGNGALNITARGNLQIRGATAESLPALTAQLDAHGLLDATAEGEAVRNVVSSPLAGHDGTALRDLRLLVAAWEARLAEDPALWRLPAKFSWRFDEGGAMSLDDVATDVRLRAVAPAEGAALDLRLGGDPAVRALVPSGEGERACARLAAAFLALCAEAGLPPHRMRDLVERLGAAAVLERAGLAPTPAPPSPALRNGTAPGLHRAGAAGFVVMTPAFGLLGATTLDAVTRAAASAGAPDIRLTPWRGLVVAGLTAAAAEGVVAQLSDSGLILVPTDPRLRVAACVGAPACARATTPVPRDAAWLAASLSPSAAITTLLHVSGCPKGCAHGGAAPLTLVGQGGAYALVRNGRAGDTPTVPALPLGALAPMLLPLLEPLA